MGEFRGAALRRLGAAVHLPHRLVGRLDEALECLAGLRHVLFRECPHLVRNCKLFKWIFCHHTLLVPWDADPSAI